MDAVLSAFISALQGPPAVQDDEGEERGREEGGEGEGGSTDGESNSTLNVWGLASTMANHVSDSMKKQAADVVTSVQATDWSAELAAFGTMVQSETAELGAKTMKALEELPDKANTVLPVLGKVARNEISDPLQAVGGTLSELGKDFVEGTRGVGSFLKGAYESGEGSLAAAFSAEKEQTPRAAPFQGEAGMRYSRYDSEVSAMQRDSSTYCDEPADSVAFTAWLKTFSVDSKKAEMAQIIGDNAFMAELLARIVPSMVDYDAFWTRYFYRLHKLTERHEQQRQLAQRTSRLRQEEEQVSWDDTHDTTSVDGNKLPGGGEVPPASSPETSMARSEVPELAQGLEREEDAARVAPLVSHPELEEDAGDASEDVARPGENVLAKICESLPELRPAVPAVEIAGASVSEMANHGELM